MNVPELLYISVAYVRNRSFKYQWNQTQPYVACEHATKQNGSISRPWLHDI